MATLRPFQIHHDETVEETCASTEAMIDELRQSTATTTRCVQHSRATIKASWQALARVARDAVKIPRDGE